MAAHLDALALHDAGTPADEIAEQLGISRSQVYRRIQQAQNGPGPTERSTRALIFSWGGMDELTTVRGESLIGLAAIADCGRSRNANGVDRNAGVAAYKELLTRLDALGQASGFEDLRAALLKDD